MTRSERREKHIRLMNQAEQIRQRFLVRGLDIANGAANAFISAKDGKRYKALRKYADSLASK